MPPRTRQRVHVHDAHGATSRLPPRRCQQTLTQAEWLTSLPHSFHDDDQDQNDAYLPDATIPHTSPRAKPSRQPKSMRNSTLTQMDFFEIPYVDEDGDDKNMVLLKLNPAEDQQPMVQLDGTYDSPRKPRKRKSPTALAHPSKRRARPTKESQEYVPRTSKRAHKNGDTPSGSTRRTSRRLAQEPTSVLSDPAENYAYFSQALRGQDGLDKGNIQTDLNGAMPTPRSEPQPQTPQRRQAIVLSSQSPESLPPSTRGRGRGLDTRSPLGERSVNRIWSPCLSKSKVVVLKLPQTMNTGPKLPKVARRRRRECVQDSQANVWSIPASSSPQVRRGASAELDDMLPSADLGVDLEIPASSAPEAQSTGSSNRPSQDRMPRAAEHDPAATSALERLNSMAIEPDGPHVTTPSRRGRATPVDLEGATGPEPTSAPVDPTVTTDAEVHPPTQLAWDEMDAGDLGSPIANDTQFNVAVLDRVSSPVPQGQPRRPPIQADARSAPSPRSSQTPQLSLTDSDETSRRSPVFKKPPPRHTGLPVPRLIEAPGTKTTSMHVVEEHDLELDEFLLPAMSPPVLTTKVPLNDVTPAPSSSPTPTCKSVTQGSVRPALLPRPSQMSTQDPTQGHFLLSSVPSLSPDGDSDDGMTERITIKDSSSLQVPLSQVPQHGDVTQPPLDIDFGLDMSDSGEDDGDLDDLDLDPRATLPAPPPASADDGDLMPPSALEAEPLAAGHEAPPPPADDDTPTVPRARPDPADPVESPVHSTPSTSPPSSLYPPPLPKQYSPIPGFDNDTQSNFTQKGHVTAAYIHRQREAGVLPNWYVPKPYQVPGYTRTR